MANTFRRVCVTGLKNGNKSQYARDLEVLKRRNDEVGMDYLGVGFESSGGSILFAQCPL